MVRRRNQQQRVKIGDIKQAVDNSLTTRALFGLNVRLLRLLIWVKSMSVTEAISYLRRQEQERVATIYYVYVLDAQ